MSFNSKEWREVTLAEISVGNKGSYGIAASAVEYSKDLYTYLRITDISDDGVLNKEGLTSVDDINAEKYLLQPNDIVFARTGNSTGRSYFYDGTDGLLVYAGFLIKFSLDPKKVNPKYMRYYTISPEYKNWVSSFSTGSTRGNINAQTYGNMKIKLPSREQQDLLVEVLSTLDKKIETNKQINKKLEEMAQAIFKQWFVDFEFPNEDGEPYKSSGGEMVESELGMIPKGWIPTTLDKIAILTMGVSPTSTSYNEKQIGLPLINGASDFDGKLIKVTKYTSEPKKVCDVGDMVFGVRATIGNTVFADNQYAIGRGVAALKEKNSIYRELIYFYLENSMAKLINNASGSVFLNLKKSDITDLKIIYSKETVMKFHNIVEPIISKIIENDRESESLKKTRDLLIPKLMSGEIRMKLNND